MKAAKLTVSGCAIGFFLLTLAALINRIFYGADLTDEAFYVALPYSFVLGHRPFADELSFIQTSGILLQPIVKLYLSVAGSSSGIVLFVRALYVLYLTFCAMLAFLLGRRFMSWQLALICAAVLLPFGHFNIFSLSYNTLGSLGFLAGCLLIALLRDSRYPTLISALALLFHASACFAYPGFVPASAFSLFIGVWCARTYVGAQAAKSIYKGLLLGAALLLVFLVPALRNLTPENAKLMMEYVGGLGYGRPLTEKLAMIGDHLFTWRWLFLYYLLSILPVAFLLKYLSRYRSLIFLLAIVSPAISVWLYETGPDNRFFATQGAFIMIAVGLVSSLLYVIRHLVMRSRNLEERWIIWTLVLPSLLGMLGSSYCSALALRSAGYMGLLPAIVAVFFIMALQFEEEAPNQELRKWLVIGMFAITLTVVQTESLYRTVYRDHPVHTLTSVVEIGPYRGISTSAERKAFLEMMQRDSERLQHPGTLMVFDRFPAGYLLSALPPRTPSVWMFWYSRGIVPVVLERYFSDFEKLPTYVMEIKSSDHTREWEIDLDSAASEPLPEILKRGSYQKILERDDYIYWKRGDRPLT